MVHGDAQEGKWRGNWRMEWVASTLHTTSEHGVSSITTTDAHTSAASSWLNWCPRRCKWTRPFHWETKSGFCECAITFQTQPTNIFKICYIQEIEMNCIGIPIYGKIIIWQSSGRRSLSNLKCRQRITTHRVQVFFPPHPTTKSRIAIIESKYHKYLQNCLYITICMVESED